MNDKVVTIHAGRSAPARSAECTPLREAEVTVFSKVQNFAMAGASKLVAGDIDRSEHIRRYDIDYIISTALDRLAHDVGEELDGATAARAMGVEWEEFTSALDSEEQDIFRSQCIALVEDALRRSVCAIRAQLTARQN